MTDQLPPALRKPNLRRWEASEYLEHVHGITIAAATLAKLASTGGGPPFFSENRTPPFPPTRLVEDPQPRPGKLVRSTSEVTA